MILWPAIGFWLILICIGYTFVGYPALMAILARFRPRSPRISAGEVPRVSVIIAAYNEAAILRLKLENCRALRYPPDFLEILAGSDGSTDATADILRDAGMDSVIFPVRRGKAAMLNALVAQATGELLLFTDANTMLDPDAVHHLAAPLSDPAIGGVCGRLDLVARDSRRAGYGETLYWWYENRLKAWEGQVHTLVGATGGIYAVRRSLFTPLPDQVGIPDDLLIPLRIAGEGFRIVYAPDARATETMPGDTTIELSRKMRIGAQDMAVLPELWRWMHPRHGFLALSLISHKLLRWSMPVLLILLLVTSFPLRNAPVYEYVWLAQLIFYGAALLGMIGDRLGFGGRLLGAPAYFVLAHAALLKGFWNALMSAPRPYWDSPDTTEET